MTCEYAKRNEPSDLHKTIEVDTFALALVGVSLTQSQQKIEHLESENKKLRKLVVDWSRLYDMAPYVDKVAGTIALRESIDRRMRDLDFAPAEETQ